MPENAVQAPIDPLTVDNSVLMLVDYQPHMYQALGGRDRDTIHRAAQAIATAADILDIPAVLTAIHPASNGEFRSDIADLLPASKVIIRQRPGFDALADDTVLEMLRATGRPKLVLTGLWTSMCMAFSALHALREGFQVYGVMDAAGDMNLEAHECGVQRMVQAGVVPVTWMQVTSEWMVDWANPKSGELTEKVYAAFNVPMSM